ncbi:MAG: cation-translocating P-type ATPase [Verrucomicrobia bacterium]|nr:cation-translocating P-type ATPase [Verrucomicrobiota bacterium]
MAHVDVSPDATSSDAGGECCIARSVVRILTEEPALEAVTFDRSRKSVSVATLGRVDEAQITARVSHELEQGCDLPSSQSCDLLMGVGDCWSCGRPLLDKDRGRVSIQHDGDRVTIARVTCPTAPRFWRWREIPWPRVVQRDVEFLEHLDAEDEWKPQLLAAGLCGGLALTARLLEVGPWTVPLYLMSYLAGSWFAAQEVWERLRQRSIDVHFLMLAVAAGSASIHAWGEGATLLFLFSLSGALEHYALGRTQREIHSLFHNAPKVAQRIDQDGREHEIAVERLRPGMRLLVRPGAQFPVDAEVVKGQTAADESNLTGEATPVSKGVGETVLAGTLNEWGVVEVVATRPASESALQKIIHLIQEAQRNKAPTQRFTDRVSTYYTYFALGLSVVMFFVWWLGFGLEPFANSDEVRSAFYRTMTLLVVASPCALVLSIPSAVLAAIAWGARHGILFRGGAAVENLAEVNVVALDKTGTLTTGELSVERVESFPPGREEEVSVLAYSLERLSTHPLARAITVHGKRIGLKAVEFDHFESVTGFGLQARRGGVHVRLGGREWIAQHGGLPAAVSPPEPGFAEVWVVQDGLAGRVLLRDDIRPQSRQVVEELRREGLRSVVLTGDRRAAGEHLRQELHVDDVRAELKPDEKVAAVKALSEGGRRVAMVGDGVNDAPSLAAAHIGVAMGARGADAALEQADVVLMHDRLENFLAAFRLSQRARRIIKQNLVVSLGTVVVLVVLALLGVIPLTVGVVGHEGSTVVVVMNSLRLLLGGVTLVKVK